MKGKIYPHLATLDGAPPTTAPLPSVPCMTLARYAELTGLSEGVVRGHAERQQLPTVKIGRRRLINLAVLYQLCLEGDAHD